MSDANKASWEFLHSPAGVVLFDAARNVARARARAVSEMRRLSDHLSKQADRLDVDPDYIHNSLGEVQGSGADVDRACALLSAARETWESLAAAFPEVVKEVLAKVKDFGREI